MQNLAVSNEPEGSVNVSKLGDAKANVFDLTADVADLNPVTDSVLIFDDNKNA